MWPVQRFGELARGLRDRNKCLWSSFVLETSVGQLYVVCDSGYGSGKHFRDVRDKLLAVVKSIREDPHPAFVEVRTYRYRGHSMSDPASYRTKEQLEKYRMDDPITRLRAQLTREG